MLVKADKREQILVAAENLFAEYGYEGTTVRDLAAEAGVNIALIAYYFGGKEQLMQTLITERTSYLRDKLEQLNRNETDPAVKLTSFIELYIDRICSKSSFHRILLRELSLQQRSRFNETISSLMLKNAEVLRKLIKDGQSAGVFKEADVELTIATLIGTINQVTLSSFFASKFLGSCESGDGIYSDKIRQRLKDHLTALLKSHLLHNGYDYTKSN